MSVSFLLAAGLESILIIGGSHLATPTHLTTPLHDGLQAKGVQVHTIGVCGSNPGDWLKVTQGTCGGLERVGEAKATLTGNKATTQPIAELIAREKPSLVMVVISDNMAGYTNPTFPEAWAWRQVTGLTKAIAATNTPCVWVGPAWGTEGGKFKKTFARAQQVSTFLSNNVAPCAYIDSLQFSKPGEWATTDGQHLTVAGYKLWADALLKQLETMPEFAKAAK